MSKQRIIATESAERWGYRGGDLLEIVRHTGDGYVVARNITNPTQYGREYALLKYSEYTYAPVEKEKPVKPDPLPPTVICEYRFLGIPFFKKTVRELLR